MNKCLILTIFVQKCACFAILVSLFGSRSIQNFSHYDDELLGTLRLFSKDCSYKRKSLPQLKLSLRSPSDTLNIKRFEFQNMTVDFVCIWVSFSRFAMISLLRISCT